MRIASSTVEMKIGTTWLGALLALLLPLAACSGSGSSGASAPGSSSACPDGFAEDSAGNGCVEVAPANDCAAGTRAALGSASCTPIANFACADGFVPDPSGWGCRDVSPAEDCAAGTIEELGNASCQPIDDCNGAFPPANATLFVDDNTVTVDATHFKTIGAAVSVAPAGAVIAVEAGTYIEGVETHVPLSIVGRCAAQVIVQTPGGMVAGMQAINVSGSVAVSGLTFNGHRGGVVEQAGDMTVTDCDVRDAQGAGLVAIGGAMHVNHTRVSGSVQSGDMGFGVFVSDSASVDLARMALAKNSVAGLAVNSNGAAKMTSSVIRESGPNSAGKAGAGVAVSEAGTATIDSSAIFANHSSNVETYDTGSSIKITNSVLRDVLADNSGNHGDGIALDSAGTVDVENTTVSGSAENGLIAIGGATAAHVSNSVFIGGGNSPQRGIGVSAGATADVTGVAIVGGRDYGMLAQDSGSSMTIAGSLVRDIVRTAASQSSDGEGVEATFGASITINDSSIVNATQVGCGVGGSGPTGSGGNATLTKVLITRAIANENGDFGRGIQVTESASLSATGCAVVDNQETGIVVGEGASADMRDSLIRGSGTIGATKYGYGAVVLSGATFSLENSSVRDNTSIGLAFDNASGSIDNAIIAHNQIGIFASNATLNDVDAPPSEMSPQEVFVSQTRFVDNATRVSSEDVPLPQVMQ